MVWFFWQMACQKTSTELDKWVAKRQASKRASEQMGYSPAFPGPGAGPQGLRVPL
jgi:hypothetical protein